MKSLKLTMAAVLALAWGNAYAFHSGGVAECDGCHTMHNSDGGAAMTSFRPQYQAGPYLLQGNQSEACLNCHQHEGDTGPSGYHISTAAADLTTAGNAENTLAVPLQMTPGGDFGWIRADVPYKIRNTPGVNKGHERGHNIVAPGYGYAADEKATAPGGTFDAAKLACSSCHDPHGKYRVTDVSKLDTQVTSGAPIKQSGSGSAALQAGFAQGTFRILGGAGYAPKSYNAVPFTAPAPVAVAPGSSSNGYNRLESVNETVITYGKGMSEFCANCHPAMLMNGYVSGTDMLRHPAGNAATLGATIATNYVAYVKTGDLSGTGSNYTSLVPFETGAVDQATLKTTASNTGAKGFGPTAASSSTVSCLSCHRAHASGFKNMLRYGHQNEFMTIADAAGAAIFDTSTTENKINLGFAGQAAQEAQYYGRPATQFAGYQRLLCNKCHVKD